MGTVSVAPVLATVQLKLAELRLTTYPGFLTPANSTSNAVLVMPAVTGSVIILLVAPIVLVDDRPPVFAVTPDKSNPVGKLQVMLLAEFEVSRLRVRFRLFVALTVVFE